MKRQNLFKNAARKHLAALLDNRIILLNFSHKTAPIQGGSVAEISNEKSNLWGLIWVLLLQKDTGIYEICVLRK